MYEESPEFKNCYHKLKSAHKLLKRRIKGRLSPSAKAARDAAIRSITNKCIKKLKIDTPLLKPESKSVKNSRRQSRRQSRRKSVKKSRRKSVRKNRRKSVRKNKKSNRK